jgi:hypothetical protein
MSFLSATGMTCGYGGADIIHDCTISVEQGEIAEAEQVFRRAYALGNGESDSIRDNLRLALAKQENQVYADAEDQEYKLVRRGSSDYLIRSIP